MTQKSYLLRVAELTPTEFWINNPTPEQTELALAHGATGCTNNPSFTQKMIDHPVEGAHALEVLDQVVREVSDDGEAIAEFQRRMAWPTCEKFLPLHQRSGGEKGYVSIQGDPIHEEDPDVVIREAMANHKLSPNVCCKIPTTQSGLTAMEYLVGQDIPLNATEIFGIRQGLFCARPTSAPAASTESRRRCIFRISPASTTII